MTLLYPSVSQNTSFEGKLLYNQGAAADRGGNSTMLSREDILMATDYRYGFSIGYSPDGAGAGRSGDPAPGQGDYQQRHFTSGTGNTSAVARLTRAAEAQGKSLNISRVGLDCHTDDSEVPKNIHLPGRSSPATYLFVVLAYFPFDIDGPSKHLDHHRSRSPSVSVRSTPAAPWGFGGR